MKSVKVSIIVPAYNVEKYLDETMKSIINQDFSGYEVILINDGSKDNTWEIIQELHEQDKIFSGVTLSRNRGHQNALLAGLMTAKKIRRYG